MRRPVGFVLLDRLRAVKENERGSTSVQMVLLMPALFAVMFLGMQGALFYHARTVALAAAQEGVRTAAGLDGTGAAGSQDAYAFVDAAGGDDVLIGARVIASRSATNATVTVSGRSLSVVPGWRPTVTQSASAPVERITQ
ncbi:TadE family protein [Nostocoides japonicum T1-X7]|uniref:TadE family protein n=1 Tax=Nostocoides japonicum T1-X7 TaxID=1194083 RepID=A0A077LVE1_9MICO|nr:TadE/TadG family type IV pilus assembly protein [Tetrasphaera japonica]CCH75950.1 TadE family protein [Tetrasphaera japonica T1-X7]